MLTVDEHNRREEERRALTAMIYRRVIVRLAGGIKLASAEIRREWANWEEQEIAKEATDGEA